MGEDSLVGLLDGWGLDDSERVFDLSLLPGNPVDDFYADLVRTGREATGSEFAQDNRSQR